MARNKLRNIDPYLINAKFDCNCAESGELIQRGARCLYYPGSKLVFSLSSKQAQDYREWRFDIDCFGANY